MRWTVFWASTEARLFIWGSLLYHLQGEEWKRIRLQRVGALHMFLHHGRSVSLKQTAAITAAAATDKIRPVLAFLKLLCF